MEDKNIHQWHRKAAPPSSGGGDKNTGGAGGQAVALPPQVPVSLSVLDYLLCQLVSMRAVVLQYQFFLAETCGLPALAEDATMHAWLELDASYSALEGLYLQSAASEALQQTATRLELLARAERERENGRARGSSSRKQRLPWQQLLEVSSEAEKAGWRCVCVCVCTCCVPVICLC